MKARIISIVIQPQIVIDDGDNLTPQQVQPMTVLWRDWPQFAAHGLQDALAQLQAQLDTQAAYGLQKSRTLQAMEVVRDAQAADANPRTKGAGRAG